MNTILKILKWLFGGVVALVAGFVVFVYARADRTYEAPYPDIVASQDSAVIARGRYIVNGPAHCAHCHAVPSEYERVALGEDVSLQGGFDFVLPIGTIYVPNVTPDMETGIGSFTDGELARALRYGVKRNGQAVMDFMPFYDLSDEDLTAVISYMRAMPAVHNERAEHDWNFLGNMIRALGGIKPMGDGDISPAPPVDSTAAYGAYLAKTVANCRGCHTQRDMKTGAWIGPEYAGQLAMEVVGENAAVVPDKHIITPNLTPDTQTGRMTLWSQAEFVQRFRKGRVIPGSPMPWESFGRMTDVDLVALYKFLRSLDPVRSEVPVGIQDGPPPSS